MPGQPGGEESVEGSKSPNEQWRLFRENRPVSGFTHLDTAAVGRSSNAVLRAVAAHAEREATEGGYVAEAAVGPMLAEGRSWLARLLGVEAGGIAFTESATASLDVLLRSWPLTEGDTVAVARSEWGPNLDAFAAHGLRVVMLPTGDGGVVDLEGLRRLLASEPPTFVHLTVVASHRPLIQPAAGAAEICHEYGVPLWLDVAQALGHVDVACGADVLYGTSRKWLTGPRGVGVIAVARSSWDRLRPRSSEMARVMTGGRSPLLLMESHEAHVAGRVGLLVAVAEFLGAGPEAVFERLADVGRQTRKALAGVPGWEVVPAAGDSAITALRPVAGQDVAGVRARLLAEQRIVVSALIPARAPRDMTGPMLRVSPHADCAPAELERLAAALTVGLPGSAACVSGVTVVPGSRRLCLYSLVVGGDGARRGLAAEQCVRRAGYP